MNYKNEFKLCFKGTLKNIPYENRKPGAIIYLINDFQYNLSFCYSLKEAKGIINYMDSLTLKELQKIFLPMQKLIIKEYKK